MIHIIPDNEKELHIESEDCDCNPQFELDEQTGEMVWIHLPFEYDYLIDNLVQI